MGACCQSETSFNPVPNNAISSALNHNDDTNSFLDMNVRDWTIDDVQLWLSSIQNDGLKSTSIAQKFEEREICGLKLMGLDTEYLQNRMNINYDDSNVIISKRDSLKSTDSNPQSISSIINQQPEPNEQVELQSIPLIQNKKSKSTALDVACTSLRMDTSVGVPSDSDQDQDDETNQTDDNLKIQISATTNATGIKTELQMINESVSMPITSPNCKNDDDLDAKIVSELENVADKALSQIEAELSCMVDDVIDVDPGLTVYCLSEHYPTISISQCEQCGILSPRKYGAEKGDPGQNLSGIDDEKESTFGNNQPSKPTIYKNLTPAQLLMVQSKQSQHSQTKHSQLNVHATTFTPSSFTPSSFTPSLGVELLHQTKSHMHYNQLQNIPQQKAIRKAKSVPNEVISGLPPIDENIFKDDEENKCEDNRKRKSKNSKDDVLITKYQAKGNITITRNLTKENGIFDTIIAERIPNLYVYMNLSTVLQSKHIEKNKDEKLIVLNYDFHHGINKEKLYCVIRPNTDGSNKWKMDNKLYSENEIESLDEKIHEIPESIRDSNEFQLKLKTSDIIEEKICDDEKMKGIIDNTPWHKTLIHSRTNNKFRLTLAVNKQEFIKRMKNCIINNKNRILKLIPIIVFDQHEYRIEHVEIVRIADDISIGISYNNQVQVASIYINKDDLLYYHYLVSPSHIKDCHCFDNFVGNIDVLTIGNPDDQKNRSNDLRRRLKTTQHLLTISNQRVTKTQKQAKSAIETAKYAQQQIQKLKKGIQRLKREKEELAKYANVGMSSGSNTPASNSSDNFVHVNKPNDKEYID